MSKVFADNLKTYRLALNMTQTDLANAVGITRSAVNNYESAKSEPNFEVLCKFANVLGADITQLLHERETKFQYLHKALVTEDEMFLLDVYRKAEPTYKSVAVDILRAHPQR